MASQITASVAGRLERGECSLSTAARITISLSKARARAGAFYTSGQWSQDEQAAEPLAGCKWQCCRVKPPSAACQGERRSARTRERFDCREVRRSRKIWRQNHGAAAIGQDTRDSPASMP